MVRPQRGGGLKLLGATTASASVKAIIDFLDAGRNGGFAGRASGLANDLGSFATLSALFGHGVMPELSPLWMAPALQEIN